MNYIVLDLEFNQYFDFKDGRGREEPKCQFEIFQIGAVKLDDNLDTVDQRGFYIRPRLYTRIHPFVQKITGVTHRDLDGAPYFEDAYEDFLGFVGKEAATMCVWGVSDINLLYKNILFYGLNAKRLSKRYIDVQRVATEFLKQPRSCSIGLRAAVEKLELDGELDYHDALNDAIYTAKVLKAVWGAGQKTENFNISTLRQKSMSKLHSVNSGLLFAYCERRLSRKLSDLEKELILKVYAKGQDNAFNSHKGKDAEAQAAAEEV